MDLPKKYSSRYVTWVYAVFIVLFATTVSLFFISRYQKPFRSSKQETDISEQQENLAKLPMVKKKIDLKEGQASPNDEASKSGNEALDDSINAKLSKKNFSDEPQKTIDDLKAPPGKAPNTVVNPVPSPPPLKSVRQKAEIYFSDESTGLTEKALDQLRTIFLILLKHPEEELHIEGYGDSSIIDRHNKNLSKLRANIVKDYFVKRGISDSRIKTFWMGSENPENVGVSQKDRKKTHQVEVRLN